MGERSDDDQEAEVIRLDVARPSRSARRAVLITPELLARAVREAEVLRALDTTRHTAEGRRRQHGSGG